MPQERMEGRSDFMTDFQVEIDKKRVHPECMRVSLRLVAITIRVAII